LWNSFSAPAGSEKQYYRVVDGHNRVIAALQYIDAYIVGDDFGLHKIRVDALRVRL